MSFRLPQASLTALTKTPYSHSIRPAFKGIANSTRFGSSAAQPQPTFSGSHSKKNGLSRKLGTYIHNGLHVVLGGIAILTLAFPHGGHDDTQHEAAPTEQVIDDGDVHHDHNEDVHDDHDEVTHSSDEAISEKIRDGLVEVDLYFHLAVLALISYDLVHHFQNKAKNRKHASVTLDEISKQLATQGIHLSVDLSSPLLSGKDIPSDTLRSANEVLNKMNLTLHADHDGTVMTPAAKSKKNAPTESPDRSTLNQEAQDLLKSIGITLTKK